MRPSDRQYSQGPMDRPSFLFFVRAVLLEGALETPSGVASRFWRSGLQKPLAVPVLIVQNSRAWSSVTCRTTAIDRAEIGRICGACGQLASKCPTVFALERNPVTANSRARSTCSSSLGSILHLVLVDPEKPSGISISCAPAADDSDSRSVGLEA